MSSSRSSRPDRACPEDPCPDQSRRLFVQSLALGGAAFGFGLLPRPSWALRSPGQTEILAGDRFHLDIGQTPVDFTGRTRPAITVNDSLPAPTLRWREGDTVVVDVANRLPPGALHAHQTTIHWHGILLPADMDGVPGMSFDGIGPGEIWRYRFRVRQSGTYWYHSHSGFQEQAGLYGALIIDPLDPEPFAYDRDYVVMLSDWTDLDPDALYARLKKMPGYDNVYKRTPADFVRDARRDGIRATLADRRMWGRMRMTPTDLSDVNARTYTYLMNGTTTLGNWTALFKPGEKIRLRVINGSAMTHFDVRIPGLKLTVVAADGQYVHPVSVDEFRIAPAETYDIVVEPSGQEAYTVFAQDLGRTGSVSGTLAVREGLRAPIPAVDPRPLLRMSDMGMQHAGMPHDRATQPADAAMSGMKGMEGGCGANMGMPMQHESSAGHGAHDGNAIDDAVSHPDSERHNPLVDMQATAPLPKLDDPGVGLRDNGRVVLRYTMLRSLFDDPDGRAPSREIVLHLTGHMEKFAWTIDGRKFAEAEPIALKYGERVRFTLVNDTMMSHPVHLHGMWSDLEDAQGAFLVRKHTLDMPPGTRRSYRVRADALGRWAYHCHLLYHMEAGMMREVRVSE